MRSPASPAILFVTPPPGHSRINGAEYTLLVAATDEVAVAEKDAFLSIFSHHPVNNPEAAWWLRRRRT